MNLKLREQKLAYNDMLDKLKISFDLEAIRFEKLVKEKAFELLNKFRLNQSEKWNDLGVQLSLIQEQPVNAVRDEM